MYYASWQIKNGISLHYVDPETFWLSLSPTSFRGFTIYLYGKQTFELEKTILSKTQLETHHGRETVFPQFERRLTIIRSLYVGPTSNENVFF